MFPSAGCSYLRAEGFSCSLGVLYEGLGISELQFLIRKIEKTNFSCKIFKTFVIKTLNPDPQVEKILDPHQIYADPNPGDECSD